MVRRSNFGFTLIEIMVVISIISFLSSILITSVTQARVKAVDVARTQTVIQVSNAIKAYKLEKGVAPTNYKADNTVALSNDTVVDGNGKNAFQRSMQILVDNHNLSQIPVTTGGVPYAYYDYGGTTGAVFGTTLATNLMVSNVNNCRINTAPSASVCTQLLSQAMSSLPSCSSPGLPQCLAWTTTDVINLSQCSGGAVWISAFLCKPNQATLDSYGFSNVSYTAIAPICANGGNYPQGICSGNDFCVCSGF